MTTDRDDIASMLAKVKAVNGPDIGLDEELRRHFGYPPKPWNYTASIDAACWLANHLLNDTPDAPEYPLEITLSSAGHSKRGLWHCRMWSGGVGDGDPSYGPTAPLAILAALLTSLKENHP